jgi:hypothetical protein
MKINYNDLVMNFGIVANYEWELPEHWRLDESPSLNIPLANDDLPLLNLHFVSTVNDPIIVGIDIQVQWSQDNEFFTVEPSYWKQNPDDLWAGEVFGEPEGAGDVETLIETIENAIENYLGVIG